MIGAAYCVIVLQIWKALYVINQLATLRNTAATSYKSLNEQPTFDNVSAQTDNAARFYSSYELTNAPSQNSTLLLNRPETNNRSFNESPALRI